jgi:Carboxypeptidase regulatory-like domain
MMGETRSRFPAAALLVALLAVTGGPVLAQGEGEVDGHVQDAQGQPLQGVSVKLVKTGKAANHQQTSDAQGNFRFNGLASGVYIAEVSHDGYGEVTCPGVRVMSGLTRRLAIKLMPAAGEQPSSCEAVAENAESPPPPPGR